MSDSPRCSIIVRAFNEEKHIGRLLSGIAKQTVRDVEIILVDSGSTDATLAIASRYPVRVVSIDPDEFSFGRSLNLGCRQARADYLVFASAHVYPVYPDWLDRLLQPFEDRQVALAYGKQRGNSATRFSEAQHFAKLYPDRSDLRQRSPLCNNANAAIRRELWLERAYDETLPGLEDVEWASWAIGAGRCLAYVAEAEVIHVHEETPKQVYNRYRREAIGLKHIRPTERFHLWSFVRLYVSNVLNDLWHAGRERMLRRNWWEILWYRMMQFWGTYRGFAYAGPVTAQLIHAFYYPRGFRPGGLEPRREITPIDYAAVGRERERLE